MSPAGEWCEHIEYAREFADHYKFHSKNSWCNVSESWKQCPICGAKRPEKPRTLAGMIGSALGVREDYVKNHGGDKEAVEWACKVIDKTEYNGLTFDGYKDWLMYKLRENAT